MNKKYIYIFILSSILNFYISAEEINKKITFKTFYAKAYLLDKPEEVVYTEKHIEEYHDNSIHTSSTFYYNNNGSKIGEMISDYSKYIKLPTYIFRNFQDKSEEGVKSEENKYLMFYKTKDNVEKTKIIEVSENSFSCQGWHYYIKNNLNKYMNEELTLDLIIPSKLDYYIFKLRYLDTKDNLLTYRIEIKNWFLRLFAPHLDLVYNLKDNGLLSYTGPSNILFLNDKPALVKILYDEGFN